MKDLLESFEQSEGIYFQRGLARNLEFEKKYLEVRAQEKRIYTDEELKNLPEIDSLHPHYQEWQMRKSSMHRLLNYIGQRKFKTILDIGCGNGWMSRHLAKKQMDIIGLDMNEFELKQGAKVHQETNLHFVYADILGKPFKRDKIVDLILLSSSIQYFQNLNFLIEEILQLLTTNGEIHILDSMIYEDHEATAAHKRSEEYFKLMGHAEMTADYFHHRWSDLAAFEYEVLYNPKSISSKISRLFNRSTSPFPWIVLKKQ